MLERRSALATAAPYRSSLLKIEESPGFSLTQLAGRDEVMAPVIGSLPERVGRAVTSGGRTVMRVGPRHVWVIGPETDDVARRLQGACAVITLSSSRTRILLEGAPARDVLAKGIALDFHPAVFVQGGFAQTGVHHMPVTVHCIGEDAFHVYALRTFAMSTWEWLTDAALEFAGR